MKVIALLGLGQNQIALVNRLHNCRPLSHIALVSTPKSKKRARLLPRVALFTFARPLKNAWHTMINSYKKEFSLPDVPNSQHIGSNSQSMIDLIEAEKPDLVLISGTDLLRQPLIDAVSKHGRLMNLHTGLSPYIKGGPNCTNWALALGEFDMIGNTIMWLDAGIDSGNIVATQRTPLQGDESLAELHRKVMDHAHDLYKNCYVSAYDGNELPSVPQKSISDGRLFLTKNWNGWQMFRAVFNFYWKFSTKTVKVKRAITLVKLT